MELLSIRRIIKKIHLRLHQLYDSFESEADWWLSDCLGEATFSYCSLTGYALNHQARKQVNLAMPHISSRPGVSTLHGAEYLNLIETLTKNKPHSILQRDAPPCIFLENDTYCSRTMNPNTPQSFEGLHEHQSRPGSVDCYLTSTSKSICGGTSKTSIPGISRSSVEHCQIMPVCVHDVIKIQRVK